MTDSNTSRAASKMPRADWIIAALVGVMLVVAVVIGYFQSVSDGTKRDRAASQAQLQRIHTALLSYAADNFRILPADFGLVSPTYIQPEHFVSMDRRRQAQIPSGDRKIISRWVIDNTDYDYIAYPGMNVSSVMSTRPLVWQRPTEGAEGLNMVFVSGEVSWKPIDEARALIAEAERHRDDAIRKSKGK